MSASEQRSDCIGAEPARPLAGLRPLGEWPLSVDRLAEEERVQLRVYQAADLSVATITPDDPRRILDEGDAPEGASDGSAAG